MNILWNGAQICIGAVIFFLPSLLSYWKRKQSRKKIACYNMALLLGILGAGWLLRLFAGGLQYGLFGFVLGISALAVWIYLVYAAWIRSA